MTVIFTNLTRELINEKLSQYKFFEFIKTNRIFVRTTSILLVVAFSILSSIIAVGITFGFDVKYAGKNIATIGNTKVFENAKTIVEENIGNEEAIKEIATPEFTLTLTVHDNLANAATVAEAIIENTDSIEEASVLYVNGQEILCAKTDELEECLETSRCRFYVEGADNNASFVDDIEIIGGYYLKSKITDIDDAKTIVESLRVKTVSTVVTDVVVPFETVTKKTSKQLADYKEVTTKGQNGLNRNTEVVETISGIESSRKVLSVNVVSKPVTQVVTQGTAISFASATERSDAKSLGFILPIDRSKFIITAYWGDGRNHKAIDLAADKGTPIFAVADGVVTESAYSSGYGYYVTIDHGNGYKTRYAHESVICVKAGQTVKQGDMIGKVGSTGRSTGNHLHFEVLKNNKQVNPADYIGLGK